MTDSSFCLTLPCSLSASCWVHVRRGFRDTWQPFGNDYGVTICDTVQSLLMAHFQEHRSCSHSLRDLSNMLLSNSPWFTAFDKPTFLRHAMSWRLNCLSVSGTPTIVGPVPCFCPRVCLDRTPLDFTRSGFNTFGVWWLSVNALYILMHISSSGRIHSSFNMYIFWRLFTSVSAQQQCNQSNVRCKEPE